MRKSLDLRALFIFVFLLLPVDAFAQTSLADIAPRVRKELLAIRSRERPDRQGQTYDPAYYFSKQPAAAGQETYPLASGFVLPGGTLVATSAHAIGRLEAVEVGTVPRFAVGSVVVVSIPADQCRVFTGTAADRSGIDAEARVEL